MTDILTMPTPNNFIQSEFTLVTNNTVHESPINGYLQVRQTANARWEASYTIRLMKASEELANDWRAFLGKLQGMYGRFYGFDPDRVTSRGTATGTPLVKGASQTGYSINIDGCTPNITMYKAGDYVTIGTEYKMVTDDCLSDGSGNATINIIPAQRIAPNDNSAIVHTNPKCIMMLNQNSVSWSSNNAKVISIQFTAREAFDYTQYLLTEGGDYLVTESGDRIIL